MELKKKTSTQDRGFSPGLQFHVQVHCLNSEIIRRRLSVLRPERITIKGKFCHGSVLVLDSLVVRASVFNARDPGSSPGPGKNFSLLVLKLANSWPLPQN